MDNEYLLPPEYRDMSRAQRALADSQATLRAEHLRRTLQMLGTTELDFDILALGADPDQVILECQDMLAAQRRIQGVLQGSY